MVDQKPQYMFYVVSGEVSLKRIGLQGEAVVLQRTRVGLVSEASLKVSHFRLSDPARTDATLAEAMALPGPVMVEVDMKAWGPFAAKFAGPILKKEAA